MISTLSGNSAASSQERNFERRDIAVNAVQSRSYHNAYVNERRHAGLVGVCLLFLSRAELCHLRNSVVGPFDALCPGAPRVPSFQLQINLPDQRYAILELAKGKLTTDPSRHTGEEVFFSSRMFDRFSIGADKTYYGHRIGNDSDWVMDWGNAGTTVFMELSNHTARTPKRIFDQYATPDDDYRFNKTVVPVSLALYGSDKLHLTFPSQESGF